MGSLISSLKHVRKWEEGEGGAHPLGGLSFICRAVDRQVIHACHGFNGVAQVRGEAQVRMAAKVGGWHRYGIVNAHLASSTEFNWRNRVF